MGPSSDRRKFLKLGMGAAGVVAFSNPLSKAFAAATCGVTPAQTPGPFYPGEAQFHQDNDLTLNNGASQKSLGQIINIHGKVLDVGCKPIAGAMVEIWQACASGRYNNSTDTNTAPLDPNFKYWGEAATDKNGEYAFRTIIPGAYPADSNWTRPPHIHFKVSRLGYRELVTQMYFKGNSLNDQDLILKDIPEDEHDSVIVEFKPLTEDGSVLIGNFDITLRSARG